MGKIIYNKGFKGGIAKQTLSPTINFIEKESFNITVTFTNNSGSEATISYGLSSPPNDDTVLLAAGATSDNVVISGLDGDTTYTIFSSANGTPENLIESGIVSIQVTTDLLLIPFMSATGGTELTYEVNGTFYKSHTFHTSANFVVNLLSTVSSKNQVDYLIIAGGGGTGAGEVGLTGENTSGGGGAGGYRTTLGTSGGNSSAESKVTINTPQSYSITVSAGGAGRTNGSNSSAFDITSIGGGSGGISVSGNQLHLPGAGGSAGGVGATGFSAVNNFPAVNGISGQGTAGGKAVNDGQGQAGGGGGAGQAGANGLITGGGKGGDGLSNTLRNGTPEFRGGGGGGGTAESFRTRAQGGSGGGGQGSFSDTGTVENGAANTGGGAGGPRGSSTQPMNGGSGIVIITYEVGEL